MTAVAAMSGALVPAALSALDTQTVTVGGSGSAIDGNRLRGFSTSPALGSISDGTSNLYGGASIVILEYDELSGGVVLGITGTLANSGWSTITIKTSVFNRSNASFSVSGGVSYWFWAGGSVSMFGTVGTNATCVFA